MSSETFAKDGGEHSDSESDQAVTVSRTNMLNHCKQRPRITDSGAYLIFMFECNQHVAPAGFGRIATLVFARPITDARAINGSLLVSQAIIFFFSRAR